MSCRYELLVVDLDGTLLRRDGRVSQANCRALEEARQAGMEVIVATGRALVESRRALEEIGHDGLVVAAGGSLLCDAVTGHTLDRRVLHQEIVRDITGTLVEHGHKVLILKDSHATGYDYLAVGKGELDPASQWWFSHLPVNVKHVDVLDEDEHPHDTVRAGAVACHTQLSPLAERMRLAMGERCCLQHWSAVTESHAVGSTTHLLEVFMANVNKWTMIESHCIQRGIDPLRVAAIGDGLNDVDLIMHAGLGVAMGNAIPEVAAVADRFTGHHEADGVASAIANIVSGRW